MVNVSRGMLGILRKVEGSQRNKEKPWRKIWFSLQEKSDKRGDLFGSSAGAEAAEAGTDEPHRKCQAHGRTRRADHLLLDLLRAVHLWPEEDPPGSCSQAVYLVRWASLWVDLRWPGRGPDCRGSDGTPVSTGGPGGCLVWLAWGGGDLNPVLCLGNASPRHRWFQSDTTHTRMGKRERKGSPWRPWWGLTQRGSASDHCERRSKAARRTRSCCGMPERRKTK